MLAERGDTADHWHLKHSLPHGVQIYICRKFVADDLKFSLLREPNRHVEVFVATYDVALTREVGGDERRDCHDWAQK